MKKILFSLALVTTLCLSCGKDSTSSSSEQSTTGSAATDTTAPAAAVTDTIPSIPRNPQAITQNGLESCINALVNSIQYDSEGHTNMANQTALTKQYCTAKFQQLARKTISYDLNVFGPNWSDFCSDGSVQIRHVKAIVPTVSEDGDTQSVKVKFGYDVYNDDFEGHVTKDCHNNDTYIYKMVKEGGEWKVDDITTDGASMLNRWKLVP